MQPGASKFLDYHYQNAINLDNRVSELITYNFSNYNAFSVVVVSKNWRRTIVVSGICIVSESESQTMDTYTDSNVRRLIDSFD